MRPQGGSHQRGDPRGERDQLGRSSGEAREHPILQHDELGRIEQALHERGHRPQHHPEDHADEDEDVKAAPRADEQPLVEDQRHPDHQGRLDQVAHRPVEGQPGARPDGRGDEGLQEDVERVVAHDRRRDHAVRGGRMEGDGGERDRDRDHRHRGQHGEPPFQHETPGARQIPRHVGDARRERERPQDADPHDRGYQPSRTCPARVAGGTVAAPRVDAGGRVGAGGVDGGARTDVRRHDRFSAAGSPGRPRRPVRR